MKHLKLNHLFGALALVASGAHAEVRGLDHVAVTVPDLEAARSFFENGLGCQTVFDLGPFMDESGTWMQDYIGTHPRAEMLIAVMKCGNVSSIELMQISSPNQNKTFPRRDDYGAASLGFYVDDLEAAIQQVEAAGGVALGGITDVNQGPETGRRFIYTQAPWGDRKSVV